MNDGDLTDSPFVCSKLEYLEKVSLSKKEAGLRDHADFLPLSESRSQMGRPWQIEQ